jgi:hypothetical protein
MLTRTREIVEKRFSPGITNILIKINENLILHVILNGGVYGNEYFIYYPFFFSEPTLKIDNQVSNQKIHKAWKGLS